MGKIILKILGWTVGTYAALNTAVIVWAYWGHICEESSNRMTVDEATNVSTVLATDFEILEEDIETARKWAGIALEPLKKAFSR